MLTVEIALFIGAVVLAALVYLAVRGRFTRGKDRKDEFTSADVIARVGEEVTLTGFAAPAGGGGAIESRLARVDCVWHSHEVRRHYWARVKSGASGEPEQVRQWDSIADHASPTSFMLAPRQPDPDDRSWAGVRVEPDDASVEGAHLCLRRVVGPPQRGGSAPGDELLPRVQGRISGIFRGETIEFEYREWAIRPGDPLVVRGKVAVRDGRPVLVAPDDGRLSVEHNGQRVHSAPIDT